MHYVYLLRSQAFEGQRYVGITSDLRRRLTEHNTGRSLHTSKYAPWRLVTYIAFSDEQKAETFERYLKSGSATPSPAKGSGEPIPRAFSRGAQKSKSSATSTRTQNYSNHDTTFSHD